MEKGLNTEFPSLFKWLIDNKLSIHFGDDKNNFFLSNETPTKTKKFMWGSISKTAQYNTAEYLGCTLIIIITESQWFIEFVKNLILSQIFDGGKATIWIIHLRVCCYITLIQSPFDYGCTSWYPLLSKTLKNKLKIGQNKCWHFCLELLRHGMQPIPFQENKLASVELRVKLCTSTTVFKYWKGIAPSFLNDILTPSPNIYSTRLHMTLGIPPCRTFKGQKSISFLGPKI